MICNDNITLIKYIKVKTLVLIYYRMSSCSTNWFVTLNVFI